MMAFSTSMGRVTNIAIQKVEAVVVVAAAVRVGRVEKKGKERTKDASNGSWNTAKEE